MSREVAERPQGDRLLTSSRGHSRVQFAELNGSREAALRGAPSGASGRIMNAVFGKVRMNEVPQPA